MRKSLPLWAILLTLLTAIGCQSFRLEAGFKQPAELTATAQALPKKPQLGKLAFVRGGDIWVKELPDGEERRLTQDGRNSEPRWSASGEWLAFRKDYQIQVVHADGSGGRTLDGVVEGDLFAWSPAEDRLAYTHRRGLSVELADGSGRKEIVPGAGVVGSPTQPRGVNAIAWSPDGQWVALQKREYSPSQPIISQGLWRAKADGSQVEEVYLNPEPSRAHSYLAGWSPDGQNLLFWQAEGVTIRVVGEGLPLMSVPISGGSPITVTNEFMLLHDDFLSWSPDGRSLVLTSGGRRITWDNKMIAVAALAGGSKNLSDTGRADLYPSWSPDGRWITFTSGPAAPGVYGSDGAHTPLSQRRIWLISPDGASKRQLTYDLSFRDERPLWSIDGSTILFARLQGDVAQLWTMRSDGSEQRQVAALTPSPDWYGDMGYLNWGSLYDWWRGNTSRKPSPSASATQMPLASITPTVTPVTESAAPPIPLQEGVAITDVGAYVAEEETGKLWRIGEAFQIWNWSPDGKTLARASTCCDGVGGLDLIDLSTGSARRLAQGNFQTFAWSPDGTQIAFTRRKEKYSSLTDTEGIYTINKDGSGLKQHSYFPGILGMSWSRRGDYLAFEVGMGNVFVLNWSSSQITEVMRSDATLLAFAWSPDGESLFLNSSGGLHFYTVDSGELRQVSPKGAANPLLWSDSAIAWSPDSSKVMSYLGKTRLDFFIMDVKTSKRLQTLPPALDASWSPDGRRIAYLGDGCNGGDWNIYTVDADGGTAKRLTDSPKSHKERAVWTPVGSSIAFSTFKEIVAVDADSGDLRTIAERVEGVGWALHLHESPWSPDGRYLFFETYGGHSICFTGKE